MKKKNSNFQKLNFNKDVISKFEIQKINGGCASAQRQCITDVDWVCNHTRPPRCG